MPDLISVLTEELERAHVVSDGRPSQTVCMGSDVEFRDDSTGKVQTVTLVYPSDADISQRKISILTPVGTALIGLSAGDFDHLGSAKRRAAAIDCPSGLRA